MKARRTRLGPGFLFAEGSVRDQLFDLNRQKKAAERGKPGLGRPVVFPGNSFPKSEKKAGQIWGVEGEKSL
jgi:hypothetical protein